MIDSGRKPPPFGPFSPPEPRKPLTETQERIAYLLARGWPIKAIGTDDKVNMSDNGVIYQLGLMARSLDLDGAGELTPRDCVLVWAFWRYPEPRKSS